MFGITCNFCFNFELEKKIGRWKIEFVSMILFAVKKDNVKDNLIILKYCPAWNNY